MHGSGVGVQSARDKSGSKKFCHGQSLGKVTFDQVGWPVLAGGEDLKQASVMFAGELMDGIEIDARIGKGVGECRGPEPAEALVPVVVS